ncbi:MULTISPECIES: hypothetical protein [unclassified Sphingomonas]|uniref:hypothetical protein n=1 Tax=unclassified Sphingomonas TaxID=196159 RepID=UPI0012E24E46|nr:MULTISPECIES: hypothetical protein [unclassified Sphingomonas]
MATQLFQPPYGSPAWFHTAATSARDGIAFHQVRLTPELANEMLKNNEGNRHVSPLLVAKYSADIVAGRWALNGEPIIVSKDGKLNDGQHRASAVIDANTPIDVVMVFGVERETRTTVDLGKVRTLSDILSMEGVANAALSAAIANMVLAYERSSGQNLHHSKYITSGESKARVHADPAIAAAATYATTKTRYAKKYVGGSAIGFCFYILSRIDLNAAHEYLDKVCMGENLKRNDPAHSVRERLLNEGKQRDKKVSVILRGWTFYRRNRSVAPTNLPASLPFPAVF